eukprot:gnl/TRDRNA2_/TRDRNA2_122703_c0_seq1.p1 gnl/TRDRNA2_/TRDRNA2_122703_c0~~gnl/TRDRNA2_/TRDRNA2_122703_c0_seq1.p1  ORF type:complete len:140 (+),score=19.45 gnl/TRDRNA2_/TRDRNA2_122703_c0_seq1:25-444(+)
MAHFKMQELATVAWAIATAGVPVPALPESVLALDDWQGAAPRVQPYEMVMQCLVAGGQLRAAFALLEHVESSCLLSEVDDSCYKMFRILSEACRIAGDPDGASQVQTAMDRHDLIVRAPAAVVHKRALETGQVVVAPVR